MYFCYKIFFSLPRKHVSFQIFPCSMYAPLLYGRKGKREKEKKEEREEEKTICNYHIHHVSTILPIGDEQR